MKNFTYLSFLIFFSMFYHDLALAHEGLELSYNLTQPSNPSAPLRPEFDLIPAILRNRIRDIENLLELNDEIIELTDTIKDYEIESSAYKKKSLPLKRKLLQNKIKDYTALIGFDEARLGGPNNWYYLAKATQNDLKWFKISLEVYFCIKNATDESQRKKYTDILYVYLCICFHLKENAISQLKTEEREISSKKYLSTVFLKEIIEILDPDISNKARLFNASIEVQSTDDFSQSRINLDFQNKPVKNLLKFITSSSNQLNTWMQNRPFDIELNQDQAEKIKSFYEKLSEFSYKIRATQNFAYTTSLQSFNTDQDMDFLKDIRVFIHRYETIANPLWNLKIKVQSLGKEVLQHLLSLSDFLDELGIEEKPAFIITSQRELERLKQSAAQKDQKKQPQHHRISEAVQQLSIEQAAIQEELLPVKEELIKEELTRQESPRLEDSVQTHSELVPAVSSSSSCGEAKKQEEGLPLKKPSQAADSRPQTELINPAKREHLQETTRARLGNLSWLDELYGNSQLGARDYEKIKKGILKLFKDLAIKHEDKSKQNFFFILFTSPVTGQAEILGGHKPHAAQDRKLHPAWRIEFKTMLKEHILDFHGISL